MDATQTSEPTEAEPASAGRASAFRRALDDQAATEGPLDLTVPLDIAEVRAALANSGPLPAVAPSPAAPPPGGPAGPGSTPPRDHEGRHSRRHAGSKRLGRIAVFVVLAATASLGTAYALVLSSGGQGSSVSLPATDGNIPVAPSERPSGQGQLSAVSGSTSASAVSSLSHSPTATARITGTPSDAASGAASSAAAGAGPSASAPSQSTQPSASAGGPSNPPTSSASASNWVTLYRGIQNESSEISQVQSMLDDLGYLDNWRHHEYMNPDFAVQPDASGTYGSATADAIAEFQQEHNLYSSPSGQCDAATYQALSQADS